MNTFLRNGAGILFVISLIVFGGVFAYQLVLLRVMDQSAAGGLSQGIAPPTWIAAIAAFAGALSAASIPFFGACTIDRLDRFVRPKEAAE